MNHDDGLPNLMCAKCKRRVESLENHTWGRKSLKGLINCLLKIIILTSLLYRVRTLTSHNTEESENSPEPPHLGEIKRMRKQCVPGASPFFAHAGDKAMERSLRSTSLKGVYFVHTVLNEQFVSTLLLFKTPALRQTLQALRQTLQALRQPLQALRQTLQALRQTLQEKPQDC